MFSHVRNPFDNRPPADTSTVGFLRKLSGEETAAAYRKAMGEEASSSMPDDHGQDLTPDELARANAADAALRETPEKKLRADYLAWAREFNLGGDDPQGWIDETFTFNPNGTVKVDGNLDLLGKKIVRLPKRLTRVNGNLNLSFNRLPSLEGLPKEIHGDLDLSDNFLTSLEGFPSEIHGHLFLVYNQLTSLEGLPSEIHGDLNLRENRLTSLEGLPSEIHGDLILVDNPLTSLDGLRGKKIDRILSLVGIPDQPISEGILLAGRVLVSASQTVLKQSAIDQGYSVQVL